MSSKSQNGSNILIEYNGTVITPDFQIERISVKSLTPQQFFQKYVAPRKPVILTELIAGFQLSDWSVDNLKKLAGGSVVKVEERGPNGGFGTALPRKTIQFSELLEKVQKALKEVEYYLTTQYEDEEEADLDDGIYLQMLHEFCPPPLPAMLNYFPHRPNLLGNLVPQQVNLWVGGSQGGTSSGLHHDFHDNLYLLLRGHKRFTIFAPSDGPKLYTHGQIRKVHTNGLINYTNREEIRSDGASKHDLLQYTLDHLEAQLEQMLDDGVIGAEKTAVEAQIKVIEDELLDELQDGVDDFDDFDELMGDDFDFSESDDDLSEEEPIIPKNKKSAKNGSKTPTSNGKSNNNGKNNGKNSNGKNSNGKSNNGKSTKQAELSFSNDDDDDEKSEQPEPNSFSRISTEELHSMSKKALKKFPLLSKAQRHTFEIKSGEMLYLPAGWFHEVTSYDVKPESGHIAFNYWFHPPALPDYSNPYEDRYWDSKWEEMVELIRDIQEQYSSGKCLLPEGLEEEEEEAMPKSKRRKMN